MIRLLYDHHHHLFLTTHHRRDSASMTSMPGALPAGVELLRLTTGPVRVTQRTSQDGEAELARGDTLSVQLVTVSVDQAYGKGFVPPSGEE